MKACYPSICRYKMILHDRMEMRVLFWSFGYTSQLTSGGSEHTRGIISTHEDKIHIFMQPFNVI